MNESLLATFSEKRAPTSTKFVAVEDILMPILLYSLHFFKKFSEFFYFLKRFWWVLPTGASTSRSYEAVKVLLILHLSQRLQVFWLQSSVFALEK